MSSWSYCSIKLIVLVSWLIQPPTPNWAVIIRSLRQYSIEWNWGDIRSIPNPTHSRQIGNVHTSRQHCSLRRSSNTFEQKARGDDGRGDNRGEHVKRWRGSKRDILSTLSVLHPAPASATLASSRPRTSTPNARNLCSLRFLSWATCFTISRSNLGGSWGDLPS